MQMMSTAKARRQPQRARNRRTPGGLVGRNMPSKDPASPYADHDGYVPFGKLVNYAAGRSDGCTSWSPSDARQIIPMVKDDPTTLYIYLESRDIGTVVRTRMPGGVGGVASRGVPLSRSCANSGRSLMAKRTDQNDSKRPFLFGPGMEGMR
jgi:hypothetical protein